ncbi:MAG: hypothetical protein ACXWOH_03980 [Bdellovibrionota bacterium]
MRSFRRAATIWLLLGIASLAISGGVLRASELSLMLRIQRDYYAPSLPLTKNFHPCFKTDPRGMQILAFCAEDDKPSRLPAAAPSIKPSVKPIKLKK